MKFFKPFITIFKIIKTPSLLFLFISSILSTTPSPVCATQGGTPTALRVYANTYAHGMYFNTVGPDFITCYWNDQMTGVSSLSYFSGYPGIQDFAITIYTTTDCSGPSYTWNFQVGSPDWFLIYDIGGFNDEVNSLRIFHQKMVEGYQGNNFPDSAPQRISVFSKMFNVGSNNGVVGPGGSGRDRGKKVGINNTVTATTTTTTTRSAGITAPVLPTTVVVKPTTTTTVKKVPTSTKMTTTTTTKTASLTTTTKR